MTRINYIKDVFRAFFDGRKKEASRLFAKLEPIIDETDYMLRRRKFNELKKEELNRIEEGKNEQGKNKGK